MGCLPLIRAKQVASAGSADTEGMPIWIQAALWGLLAGGALLLGSAISYLLDVPRRVTALVMAFGSGVLISALAFDLMAEAHERGGIGATAAGFLAGAMVYTVANWGLARQGAQHRKRSGSQQPSEEESGGSGTAIALGALLDGIPESMVIGLSLLHGSGVSVATVAAIFLSNLPEGLSSAAGMKKAGRSARYIFGVWGAIALASGIAAAAGAALFASAPAWAVAFTTAIAAGAILSMITDTMIPEAFEEAHIATGLVTALGFLTAFALHQQSG